MQDAIETKDARSPMNPNHSKQSIPKENWRRGWDSLRCAPSLQIALCGCDDGFAFRKTWQSNPVASPRLVGATLKGSLAQPQNAITPAQTSWAGVMADGLGSPDMVDNLLIS